MFFFSLTTIDPILHRSDPRQWLPSTLPSFPSLFIPSPHKEQRLPTTSFRLHSRTMSQRASCRTSNCSNPLTTSFIPLPPPPLSLPFMSLMTQDSLPAHHLSTRKHAINHPLINSRQNFRQRMQPLLSHLKVTKKRTNPPTCRSFSFLRAYKKAKKLSSHRPPESVSVSVDLPFQKEVVPFIQKPMRHSTRSIRYTKRCQ